MSKELNCCNGTSFCSGSVHGRASLFRGRHQRHGSSTQRIATTPRRSAVGTRERERSNCRDPATPRHVFSQCMHAHNWQSINIIRNGSETSSLLCLMKVSSRGKPRYTLERSMLTWRPHRSHTFKQTIHYATIQGLALDCDESRHAAQTWCNLLVAYGTRKVTFARRVRILTMADETQ